MESAGEALGDTRAFLVDLIGLVALVDLVDLLDLIFLNFFGGLLSDKDDEEVDESLELDPVRPEMSDKGTSTQIQIQIQIHPKGS